MNDPETMSPKDLKEEIARANGWETCPKGFWYDNVKKVGTWNFTSLDCPDYSKPEGALELLMGLVTFQTLHSYSFSTGGRKDPYVFESLNFRDMDSTIQFKANNEEQLILAILRMWITKNRELEGKLAELLKPCQFYTRI